MTELSRDSSSKPCLNLICWRKYSQLSLSEPHLKLIWPLNLKFFPYTFVVFLLHIPCSPFNLDLQLSQPWFSVQRGNFKVFLVIHGFTMVEKKNGYGENKLPWHSTWRGRKRSLRQNNTNNHLTNLILLYKHHCLNWHPLNEKFSPQWKYQLKPELVTFIAN